MSCLQGSVRSGEAARGQPVAARCHGTVGELWQGPVEDAGGPAELGLVAFPVPLSSEVSFTACDGCPSCETSFARLRPLQRAAVSSYAEARDETLPRGLWDHASELPVGVGMSSSTADIVAAVRCAATVLGRVADGPTLQDVMWRIERSDPVHLDHPVVYLSARQHVARSFGPVALPFDAVYTYRGAVNTADVTETVLLEHYAEHRDAYATTFDVLCTALAAGNVVAVARVATTSARLAQEYLFDPVVDTLLAEYERVGAAGVVRAHSGTAAGLLFTGPPRPAERAAARSLFAGLGVEPYDVQGGFRVPTHR